MKLYTLEETAEILKVSPGTVRNLLNKKKIVGTRVGTQLRFTEENIQRYLDQSQFLMIDGEQVFLTDLKKHKK